MNGNPFYVDPFGGYGQSIVQGLSGLGAVLGEHQAMKKQKAQEQDLIMRARKVMQSGNPDAIADFMLENPKMAQRVAGAVKFKNEITEKNMREGMERIIVGEDPIQVMGNRIRTVLEQGGDPSDTIRESMRYQEEFGQNPDAYRQIVAESYAMRFPQEFKAYREAQGSTRSQPFQQGTGPLAGYVFDPNTGQFKAAFPDGEMPTRDTRTATQKDVEYIKTLRDRGDDVMADALEVKLKIRPSEPPEVAAAEATFQKENVLSTFDRSLGAIDSILTDPALSGNVYWRAATRKLPMSEARAFEGKIGVLQSQAFLNEIEKMKGLGALSENEGKKVADAVANLDTLQDNDSLKAQIKIAQEIFTQGRERAKRKLDVIEREAQRKVKNQGKQAPSTTPKISDAQINEMARQAGAPPDQFREFLRATGRL